MLSVPTRPLTLHQQVHGGMDATIVLVLELCNLLPVVLQELRKIVIQLHISRSRVHLRNLRPRIYTVELYNLLGNLMDGVAVDVHSRLRFYSNSCKLFESLPLVCEGFQLRLHLQPMRGRLVLGNPSHRVRN